MCTRLDKKISIPDSTLAKKFIKKDKKVNLNISSFADIKLREYLVLIEGKTNKSVSPQSTQKKTKEIEKKELSAATGIRTRVTSLGSLDPNH